MHEKLREKKTMKNKVVCFEKKINGSTNKKKKEDINAERAHKN